MLLDRIFNLLRDSEIHRVPSRTFSEIMSHVRSDNLGWRFFVDSINKLHEAGETDDLFFEKGLNIVRGLLRSMPTFDQSLINLFIDHTLVPYFENQSTVVRKQVVVTLAELRLAMETRLQTQCALYEITFESLMEGKLKAGSLKLVQIYFERLIKDMANTSISHLNQCSSDTGYRAFYEESYSSELLSGAASTQTANQRSSKQQQLSNLLQNGSQDNQHHFVSDTVSNATIFTCQTTQSGNEGAEQVSILRRTRMQRKSHLTTAKKTKSPPHKKQQQLM